MALSIRSVGQRLILHVREDDADADFNLSACSTLEIVFKKPDGTEVSKPAVILNPPGTDGRLYYEIEGGFLSAGKWFFRGILTVDVNHIYYTGWGQFVPYD